MLSSTLSIACSEMSDSVSCRTTNDSVWSSPDVSTEATDPFLPQLSAVSSACSGFVSSGVERLGLPLVNKKNTTLVFVAVAAVSFLVQIYNLQPRITLI